MIQDAAVRNLPGNAVPNLTVAYDASGNVLSKSDVGSYTYHPTRKHAVTAAGANSYAYDGNGNVSTRNGLSQTWASFDLPTLLRSGSFQSELWYGPTHRRWKQVGTYTNGTQTTHYAGGLLDKGAATSTGLTYWRHYVPTPDWATIGNTTRDGYTGHEMLDDVALVHMNGRVYDPGIGRFLSVDPLIGDPGDSQAVNP